MDLSLDEKIKLVSGSGMWSTNDLNGKINKIIFADGPHGVRKELADNSYADSEKATCFPTASCVASSWDTKLIGQMAEAIAYEAIEKDIDIILGPGINIKRTPVCGRNFEYFSEDPFLAGNLAQAYINAAEKMGVGTSIKHYAVNNQEANRQTANSQVDERALREIYLRGFQIALSKSNPATLMCSYNRVNGSYASENSYLLTDILRKEWGYKGCVISDWGACINLPKSIEAGMDLEMPDSLGFHGRELKKHLKKNLLDQRHLDRASENVLKLIEKYAGKKEIIEDKKFIDNHEIARKISNQSAVLLKNDGVLPIDKKEDKEIILIGKLAEKFRFQGGGSSFINPKKLINPIESFKNEGFLVKYAPGYLLDTEEIDDKLVAEALDIAKSKGKIIFFGGLTEEVEGEGFDRLDLHMPANQIHLIKELSKLHKEIIYISFSGAPYRVDILDDVSAFLQMYLAGEACAESIVDLVTGRVNPSGKLAETWPIDLEDVLAHDYYTDSSKDLQYRESLFVGYRAFDSYNIKTRFDFGYGLSYTEFEYSDLEINLNENKDYSLSFNLKNIGNFDGAEISQVYIKNPDQYFLRAKRELKGFTKTFLKAGQEKRVEIQLDDNAFSIFDVRDKRFLENFGQYEIQVSSSLNDIRLRKEVQINSEKYTKVERSALAQYFVDEKPQINESSFEYLYDKRLSNFDKTWIGEYTLYNSINDMSKISWMAKLIRFIMERSIKSMYKDASTTQLKMMIEGARTGPFDTVISQSNIHLLRNLGLFMVDLCNKRRFKAIKSLIFGG